MRLMKRFMRPVVYLMCASTISYWPLSVAVMARPVEAPPPVPVITPADVLLEQQATFETLFGVPYDPNHWTYPLDAVITGSGAYTGHNEQGQPFDFNVFATVSVPISSIPDLTVAQQRFLVNNNFAFTTVIGQLSTDLGVVGVTGLAISQANPTVPFDSRFVLSYTVNNDNPIFWPQSSSMMAPPSDPNPPAEYDSVGISIPIPIPIFCPDPRCTAACNDTYNDAVDAATTAFDDASDAAMDTCDAAVDAAQATHDSTMATAQGTFNSAVNTANADYSSTQTWAAADLSVLMTAATIALIKFNITCLVSTGFTWWTGGLATLACSLAAHAAYAWAVHAAVGAYESTMQVAKLVKDAAIAAANTAYSTATAAANAAYNATKAAAEAARDAAIAAAQAALDAAISDAQQALDDCLHGCPYVICGWIIIWVPIFN